MLSLKAKTFLEGLHVLCAAAAAILQNKWPQGSWNDLIKANNQFNSHIFHAMTQSCVAWETSLKLSWILTFPCGLLSRNSDVHRSDEILESFGF